MAADELIDSILDEALQRTRRGELVQVEDYCLEYPDLADELRLLLPAMAVLEKPIQIAASREVPTPSKIADYEIIRQIGRGGMGIVYEAIQRPLGRRVALKVISASGLHEKTSVDRFRREAETVARMHHTNIIPVFDFGESSGSAYYAMQLIQGINLRQLLCFEHEPVGPWPASTGQRQRAVEVPTAAVSAGSTNLNLLPTPVPSSAPPIDAGSYTWRDYLRIISQVAAGLDYAHHQGILHRDIKPSNIMLDERGVAWIADFGLAKLLDGSELTQTGEIVGTLRYIAPERFQGKQDERSDIYSLGLTLFELLEQRPAFTAQDRIHLIQQITDGPGPRLDSRSSRNLGRVGPDLQRVIAKAIARDPDQRYQTAKLFADDLDRILNGYPVLANRLSLTRTLWFWSKRNPLAASLAVSTALALLIGSLVTSYLALHWRQASRQATAESVRSNHSLDLTRKALAEMTSAVVEQTLAGQETLTETQKEFLRNILLYNQQLVKLAGSDEASRALAAESQFQVSMLRHLLGDSELALQDAVVARTAWQQLTNDFPDSVKYKTKTATTDNGIGKILSEGGQNQLALPHYLSAQTLITELLQANADDDSLKSPAAMIEMNIANIRQDNGDYQAAIQGYRKAIEWQRTYLERYPQDDYGLEELARTLHNLALTYLKNETLLEAQAVAAESLQMAESMVTHSPTTIRQAELQSTRIACGRIELELGNLEAAQNHFQAAIDALKQISAVIPTVPQYRRNLALALQHLAKVHEQAKTPQPTLWCLQQSLDILTQLAADFPGSIHFGHELTDARVELAIYLTDSDPEQAIALFAKAAEHWKSFVGDESQGTRAQFQLARINNRLGLIRKGLPEQRALALEHFLEAAKQCSEVLARQHDAINTQTLLGGIYCNLGALKAANKQPQEAKEAFDQAIVTLNKLPVSTRENSEPLEYLVKSHAGRAGVLNSLDDLAGSGEDWQRVIDLKAVPSTQALARINLGLLSLRRDDYAAALPLAQQATEFELSPVQKCYLALLFAKLADHPEGQTTQSTYLGQAATLLKQVEQENPAALDSLRNNSLFKKYRTDLFPAEKVD